MADCTRKSSRTECSSCPIRSWAGSTQSEPREGAFPFATTNPLTQQSTLCPHSFGRRRAVWHFKRRVSRHGCATRRKLRFSARIRGMDGTPALRVQFAVDDGTLLDRRICRDFPLNGKNMAATLHPKAMTRRARHVMDGKGRWIST